MEIKKITQTATYLQHELIIESDDIEITYTVNTAHLSNGKSWVQNYSRNYGVGQFNLKLKNCERKKVKKFFETEFLNYANYKNDNSIHNPSPLE